MCVCRRDVVLKLLQYEASTNVEDNKGCFPLHLAAWRGDVDIVRILIHHGPSHCRVNQQARLPQHHFSDTNLPFNSLFYHWRRSGSFSGAGPNLISGNRLGTANHKQHPVWTCCPILLLFVHCCVLCKEYYINDFTFP